MTTIIALQLKRGGNIYRLIQGSSDLFKRVMTTIQLIYQIKATNKARSAKDITINRLFASFPDVAFKILLENDQTSFSIDYRSDEMIRELAFQGSITLLNPVSKENQDHYNTFLKIYILFCLRNDEKFHSQKDKDLDQELRKRQKVNRIKTQISIMCTQILSDCISEERRALLDILNISMITKQLDGFKQVEEKP